MPEDSEEFMMDVIAGTTVGAMSRSRLVGTGSSGQVVGRLSAISLETSPSESGVNSWSVVVVQVVTWGEFSAENFN